MIDTEKYDADTVKKIYALYNRGFNEEELALILNEKSIISGIVCRIYSVSDKILKYNLEIDEDLDYNKILQSKDKATIDNCIVTRFNELKSKLNDNEDLKSDIEFIIKEAINVYSNEM